MTEDTGLFNLTSHFKNGRFLKDKHFIIGTLDVSSLLGNFNTNANIIGLYSIHIIRTSSFILTPINLSKYVITIRYNSEKFI